MKKIFIMLLICLFVFIIVIVHFDKTNDSTKVTSNTEDIISFLENN